MTHALPDIQPDVRPHIEPDPPTELPRHYLQSCLLLLISDDPTYGYDLRDRLPELGLVQRDWGQLYRTLRGMEQAGLVLSCWESSGAGPSRRTYHLTEKGAERLAEWAHGMERGQARVNLFLSRYGRAHPAGAGLSSPSLGPRGRRPGPSAAAG